MVIKSDAGCNSIALNFIILITIKVLTAWFTINIKKCEILDKYFKLYVKLVSLLDFDIKIENVINVIFTTETEMFNIIQNGHGVRVMVFNATFNNISVCQGSQFYWWRKRRTWRNPLTCHKSLTNLIT